jgi:hypothetical protein
MAVEYEDGKLLCRECWPIVGERFMVTLPL